MDVKVNKIIAPGTKGTQELAWISQAQLAAAFIALLAKLDGDDGVDDNDYEETLTPANKVIE